MEKVQAIEQAAIALLRDGKEQAKTIITKEYPFCRLSSEERKYTEKQKLAQFIRDGFIDRYSGGKLLNPGILKVLSFYCPEEFPYHPHWKMEECHSAYWEFVPTVDHIVPVALGGADTEENWASTSMLHNSIKSNWTLEQLQWHLYDAGDFEAWDGLTHLFLQLVEQEEALLTDSYIRKWYRLSKAAVAKRG